MSHFTRKILPFRSKLLRVLAERIVRTPESKIFCTGMPQVLPILEVGIGPKLYVLVAVVRVKIKQFLLPVFIE